MLRNIVATVGALALLSACGGGDGGKEEPRHAKAVAALKSAYESCDSTNAELTGKGTVLTVKAPDADSMPLGIFCIINELDAPNAVTKALGRTTTDAVMETVVDGGFTYVVMGLPGSDPRVIVAVDSAASQRRERDEVASGTTEEDWIARLRETDATLQDASDDEVRAAAELNCDLLEAVGGFERVADAMLAGAVPQEELGTRASVLVISIQWRCPEYTDDAKEVIQRRLGGQG